MQKNINIKKKLFFEVKNQLLKNLNLKIVVKFFSFFKKIKLFFIGLDVKMFFKAKDVINNLLVLNKNSSFLFKFLVDLIIEDFPKLKKRYFVRYIFRSINFCKKLYVILNIKEFKPLFSIINLFKSAYWLEREAWDLYGVFFLFNKDMRRLLTDYGFRGNPLKKDFPLIGFIELYFSFFWQKLKYQEVKNTQKKSEHLLI